MLFSIFFFVENIIILSVYTHFDYGSKQSEKNVNTFEIGMHIIPYDSIKLSSENGMDNITVSAFSQFVILHYLFVFYHPNIHIMELTE